MWRRGSTGWISKSRPWSIAWTPRSRQAVDRRLDLKLTALQGEMVLLKWMMGFVLAFQVAIFAKLFLH